MQTKCIRKVKRKQHHIHFPLHTHTNIHIYTHKQTHTHTYIYTHTHTHRWHMDGYIFLSFLCSDTFCNVFTHIYNINNWQDCTHNSFVFSSLNHKLTMTTKAYYTFVLPQTTLKYKNTIALRFKALKQYLNTYI